MTIKRKCEIEQLAAEFRRSMGINSIGISNIFEVCSSKYYLIRYPLGSDAVLGAVIFRDGDFIVFSNSSSILSREIFSVAHEIGHIILGHVGPNTTVIQDMSLDDSNTNEAEANYFAASLLMPKNKVTEFIDTQLQGNEKLSTLEIAAIMSTFNVSFDTVVNRLETLGKITAAEHRALLLRKSDTTVSRLLRAIGVAPTLCYAQEIKSIPFEFLQWVRYNYQHGLIPVETLQKATEYLDGVSVEDFNTEPPEDNDDFDLDAFFEAENQ